MIYSQKASRRDPQIEILSYGEEEGKINESFQLNILFVMLVIYKKIAKFFNSSGPRNELILWLLSESEKILTSLSKVINKLMQNLHEFINL